MCGAPKRKPQSRVLKYFLPKVSTNVMCLRRKFEKCDKFAFLNRNTSKHTNYIS